MPVRYEIDAKRRRIIATVSGQVSLAEIFAAITASVDDPEFEPGFDVYSDHTQISRALDTQQVMAVTGHLQGLTDRLAGARWAIVTTSPASFGMMRMFSVYAERVPMEVEVFESAEEAEEWLS